MNFHNWPKIVFIKRPIIQKKMLGLSTNHMGSEVLFDKTEFFTKSYGAKQSVKKTFEEFPEFIEFGKPTLYEKPSRNDVQEEIASQKPKEDTLRFNHNNGYNSSYGNGYNNDQSYNSGQNHKGFCIRHSDQSNIIPTSHFQIQHIIVGNNGKTKIMLRTFVIHAVKPLRQSKGDHFVFVVFTIKDSFFLIISGTNLVHV